MYHFMKQIWLSRVFGRQERRLIAQVFRRCLRGAVKHGSLANLIRFMSRSSDSSLMQRRVPIAFMRQV